MSEDIYTLDKLLQDMASTYTRQISLPKFTKSPYSICIVDLQSQQYYFQFYWNNRHQRCYLSIFRLEDGVRKYYLKNKSLKIGLNLSKYVYNEDWEGVLRVDSYTNNAYDDYTMSDIHEKIILTYYGSA